MEEHSIAVEVHIGAMELHVVAERRNGKEQQGDGVARRCGAMKRNGIA